MLPSFRFKNIKKNIPTREIRMYKNPLGIIQLLLILNFDKKTTCCVICVGSNTFWKLLSKKFLLNFNLLIFTFMLFLVLKVKCNAYQTMILND